MNRRSFIRMLGIGVVATPLLAKFTTRQPVSGEAAKGLENGFDAFDHNALMRMAASLKKQSMPRFAGYWENGVFVKHEPLFEDGYTVRYRVVPLSAP